jgi:hypothetical protein
VFVPESDLFLRSACFVEDEENRSGPFLEASLTMMPTGVTYKMTGGPLAVLCKDAAVDLFVPSPTELRFQPSTSGTILY